MPFDRDRFLGAKPKLTPCELDGYGTYYVRELSVADVERINDMQASELDKGIALLMAVVADEDGKAVFTKVDADGLKKLPHRTLLPMIEQATTACGLQEVDSDAEGKSVTRQDSGTG